MSANPESPHTAKRLRQIGLLTLLVGLSAAAIVGGLELAHPSDTDDNSLTDGYYKSQSAQMQRMTGNLGPVALTLREDLFRCLPAILIAIASVLVAVSCFYLAIRSDRAG